MVAVPAKPGQNLDYLISQQILSLPPSKAQQRQIQIVEAAIKVFAAVGIEKATYDKIAKICRVTRPLIQHYFPDKEQLFELVVKYIRGHFQAIAIRAIERGTSETEQLKSYISSTFRWLDDFPEHVQVWMLFYFLSSHHAKYRKINTELVGMGHGRIAALIERGTESGQFESKDYQIDAKLIQTAITGALVSLTTEDFSIDRKVFEKQVVEECLRIIQPRPTKKKRRV